MKNMRPRDWATCSGTHSKQVEELGSILSNLVSELLHHVASAVDERNPSVIPKKCSFLWLIPLLGSMLSKVILTWEIHAPESYNIYFHILFLTVGEWRSETNRIKFFTAQLSLMGLPWGLRLHGMCVWAARNLSPCSSAHTLSCPPYLPSPQPVGSTPHAPWFLLASGLFCYLLSTFSLIKTPSPKGICEMRSVPASQLTLRSQNA